MVTGYDRRIDSGQGRRMKQCGWVVVQVYGGGASMNGWRMRQTQEQRDRGRKGQKGTHDDWACMYGWMDVWSMDGWVQFESFLNADRQRERIAVIRTQDDDSIQPWKW